MSEYVENLAPVTSMDSVPAKYEVPAGEILAISSYSTSAPTIEEGHVVAVIDAVNESTLTHAEVIDAGSNPQKDEVTGEVGKFLVACSVWDGDHLTEQKTERLRRGVAARPTDELIVGINQDGRLLIANKSSSSLLVQNKKAEAPTYPRPEADQQASHVATVEVVEAAEGKPALPQRKPRQGDQIPISSGKEVMDETPVDVTQVNRTEAGGIVLPKSRLHNRRTAILPIPDPNPQESETDQKTD